MVAQWYQWYKPAKQLLYVTNILLEFVKMSHPTLGSLVNSVALVDCVTAWRNHVTLHTVLVNDPQHDATPIGDMVHTNINLNEMPALSTVLIALQRMWGLVEIVERPHQISLADFGQKLSVSEHPVTTGESDELLIVVESLQERRLISERVTKIKHRLARLSNALHRRIVTSSRSGNFLATAHSYRLPR